MRRFSVPSSLLCLLPLFCLPNMSAAEAQSVDQTSTTQEAWTRCLVGNGFSAIEKSPEHAADEAFEACSAQESAFLELQFVEAASDEARMNAIRTRMHAGVRANLIGWIVQDRSEEKGERSAKNEAIVHMTHPYLGKAGAPTSCAALLHDYEDVSKDLAWNQVSRLDAASNQCILATLDYSYLTHARIVVKQMKRAGCSVPKLAPSASRYLVSAHLCHFDQISSDIQAQLNRSGAGSTRCDRSNWSASPR